MSKGDFITLHLAHGPVTVTATKAGRTVKLVATSRIYSAQELSGKKVMHEIKAAVKDVSAVERRLRYGSSS